MMHGFIRYLRFILRRERLISSLWIGLIAVFTFYIAEMYPTLLGDDVAKTAMMEMLKSPAMVGMMGPVYGGDVYTAGIAFSQMMTVWVMMAVAAMNIFFVNRHTRADEEQGRLEMLRSFPVGRLTNSGATIVGAFMLNAIIALLSCAGIAAVRFEGYTLAGAMAYACGISAFGFQMAAVTLLCAQLFSTSRGASGAAFLVLGVFYMMRAAGDYTDGILSYLSPMGLGFRVYAFHENNLYPMIILLAEAAAWTAASLWICVGRDLGEGLIPARKGRAHAKRSLGTPLGFALRLTKNAAMAWCAIVFIIAAMYGSMLGDIGSFVESNDFYKQMMQLDSTTADGLTDGFIALLLLIMAHIAVIPVILIGGKLRAEESHGRLAPILARSVERIHMIITFAIIAFVMSALLLLLTVLGLYAASMGTGVEAFGPLLKAGMCYLPAMWVFAGMSIFVTGTFPRAGAIVWLLCAYSFGAVYLGRMLELPEIFLKLSPFGLTPQLPVQVLSVTPMLLMVLLGMAFVLLGVWRFRMRDIA